MADIASILGAGAQVASSIGSLIGARKDKKAAEASALKSWQRNYDAQKEFAQNSIQWRMQDAKAAGINPYAAIGGQTAGYTPQDTSYQTSYQHAISSGMNALSDAMGQLNVASVAEDVKGKKLDNEKKAIELMNKAAAASLGQTPKTFTNPFEKATGSQVLTTASGHQVPLPPQEMSFDDLAGLAAGAETLFNVDAADRIREANGGSGDVGLGVLGVRYAPEGSRPLSKANVAAADLARKTGTLTGLFSLPSLWLRDFLNGLDMDYWRKSRTSRKPLDKATRDLLTR